MQTHIVRKGDTLGTIARRYYGDPRRYPLIVSANAIADPDRLAVGQQLVIPDAAVAASGLSASVPTPPAGPGSSTGAAGLSEARLARVHPLLAARGRTLIELCAHAGTSLLVTQGLRTWAEQDALYAQGRTLAPIGASHVVTKAKGGQSYHNFGLAFDVVVLDSLGKADWDEGHPGWQTAARLGKSLSLEWGGDWKSFKDLPHFQYTNGLTLAQCREHYATGGLPAVWQEVS